MKKLNGIFPTDDTLQSGKSKFKNSKQHGISYEKTHSWIPIFDNYKICRLLTKKIFYNDKQYGEEIIRQIFTK